MVKVTLRNHIKQRKVWVDRDVTRISGDALSKHWSPHEKRRFNFVAEHGEISLTRSFKLLPEVGKWHGAKRVLMRLVKDGMLQQVHGATVQRDSHSYYTLPEA
jgi:hypothetical protein